MTWSIMEYHPGAKEHTIGEDGDMFNAFTCERSTLIGYSELLRQVNKSENVIKVRLTCRSVNPVL